MRSGFFDEIPQGMFSDFDQIGSGSFSDIFSAIHVQTNTKVALKIMFKSDDQEEMRSIQQEIRINKTLDHPFICKFFTEIETEHLIIIVMELIEGTNTLDYVNQNSGLPITEAKNLFAQLVIAMEYLHNEAHITHRDLKLENVMIDGFGHIRLIDFGFSSVNTMMSTCCGSIPYCAPEILLEQKYTRAADIWSMGVILYAFIDGNLPFYHSNMNALATMICQKEVAFSNTFGDEVKELIRKMLMKDPEQRITIEEIKRHPFISDEKLIQINYKKLFSSHELDTDMNISLAANRSSQLYNNYIYNKLITSSASNFQTGTKMTKKNFQITKPSPSGAATQSDHDIVLGRSPNNSSDLTLNESILCRKDFPLKLNNLIEKELMNHETLEFAPIPRNPHDRFQLKLKRNAQAVKRHTHTVFKNSPQLFQPRFNNQNSIVYHYFEKK